MAAVEWDTARVSKFFDYATERQEIWHKRYVLKQPPPWTDDPALRQYHFCNAYRELDRGTIFCVKRVMGNALLIDALPRILFYRLLNSPTTYDLAAPYLEATPFNWQALHAALVTAKTSGQALFHVAYVTAATGLKGDGTKLRAYCEGVSKAYEAREALVQQLTAAGSFQVAWQAVRTLPWAGPFVAYQVVLDLALRYFNWNLNTWCYMGPGAVKGIKRLLPAVKATTYNAATAVLWQNSTTQLTQRNFKFLKHGGKIVPWTLQDCEFTLCEFNKYMRLETGGKRRLYQPQGEKDEAKFYSAR